jgi:hypothetical protein
MVSGLLMELTITLLDGHRGGGALRAAPAAAPAVAGGLGRAAGPGHRCGLGGRYLDDGDAVLIVDETADEKSSADAVGVARQYSGTLGGVALCQMAVTLTYASGRGHALIGRALYLPESARLMRSTVTWPGCRRS